MQIYSKGKLVGLVLPTLMACFTWTPCSEQTKFSKGKNQKRSCIAHSKWLLQALHCTAERGSRNHLKNPGSQRVLQTNHLQALSKKSNRRKKSQLQSGWRLKKPDWGAEMRHTVLAGVLVKRRSSTRQIIHGVGVCPLRKARLGLRSVLHWQTTSNIHIIYIHVRVQSSYRETGH